MPVDDRFGDGAPGTAAAAAHDIRRYESAIWSLYTLSDNTSLPVNVRAACRLAADRAVESLAPGDPRVAVLVEFVIEAGTGDRAPKDSDLVARLGRAGVAVTAADLQSPPPPLASPPSATPVTDRERLKALDRVLAAAEAQLKDPDLTPEETQRFRARLERLRAQQADVRTKTELAWALLDSIERSLFHRAQRTGKGGQPEAPHAP